MRLPKDWGQVTLKQYIKLSKIDPELEDMDRHVKTISILSGEPEIKVWDLSLSFIKQAIAKTKFIYSQPESKGVRTSIRIKGNRFHIDNNVRHICGGEYIDLTSFLKEKDKITDNLPHILAIFFKPVNFLGLKKKRHYRKNDKGILIQTLESRNETAKLLEEHLTMDIAMGLSAFFLKNWEASIKAIQDYSIGEMEKQTKKVKKIMKKVL